MKNKYALLIVLLHYIVTGCVENEVQPDTPVIINIEDNIDNTEVFKLSYYAKGIKYVPLQQWNYFYLSPHSNYDFLDSLMLVYHVNYCMLYNTNGEFINSIGSRGNGPGEYQFCINAGFSGANSVFIQNNMYDLSEYRLDGTFIRRYNNIFRTGSSESSYAEDWMVVNDSLFLFSVPNFSGHEEHKALLINRFGEVIRAWPNFEKFERKGASSSERSTYLYSFKGDIHLKQYFNDTLFRLDQNMDLIPEYIFDAGAYKMPLQVRTSSYGGKELWSYITVEDIFETADLVLFRCLFGNRFPARRITPMKTPFGESWFTTTYMLGIFRKKSGEFSFCKPESTDNPLNTTGILNDFDCGPRFFPQKMINDSVMVMAVDAKDLKDHITGDDFRKGKAQYPESKAVLEKLASGINPLDNPVLMFVTLKSKK